MELIVSLMIATLFGSVGGYFSAVNKYHPDNFVEQEFCDESVAKIRKESVKFKRCWKSQETKNEIEQDK